MINKKDNMDKRYKIFISTTYSDLIKEREIVKQAVLELNYFPAGMEQFSTIGMPSKDDIEMALKDCDYYILIIAAKYESMTRDWLSYIEWEYDIATKSGLPVIAFFHNDIDYKPSGRTDENDVKREKLRAFRKKLEEDCQTDIIRYSGDNLKSRVILNVPKAIKIYPKRGWMRCGMSLEEARKRSESIETELREMKCSLDISSDSIATMPFKIKGVEFKMVFVKGGTFVMGATKEQAESADQNEYPAHLVTLKDYWIGETPVTQELWETVMGYNPSYFSKIRNCVNCLKRPVEQVTWCECKEFILKLNNELKTELMVTGMEFSLPTEAQWEYAARGGNKRKGDTCYKYAGGNAIDDVAWYTLTSKEETHKVADKKNPNELGVFDMSGNVWEWCEDTYSDYSEDHQTDPVCSIDSTRRVGRGGCWHSEYKCCRVSYRTSANKTHAGNGLGLRLALSGKRK